ncbi:hypothetical protein ACFCT7_15485 [Fulvivirgaceae bacterium LMO-SS25]
MKILEHKAIDGLLRILSSRLISAMAIVVAVAGGIRVFVNYWNRFFIPKELSGDETLFLQSFQSTLTNGWYESTATGSASFFNLTGLLFDPLFSDSIYTLRFIGVLSLVLTIVVWSYFAWRTLQIKGIMLVQLIAFLILVGPMRNHYFRIYTDGLFVLFLSLAIIYLTISCLRMSKAQNFVWTTLLAGLFLGISTAIRELVILYIPGLLLVFLLLIYWQRKRAIPVMVYFGVGLLVAVLALHYPAIVEHGTLSVQSKQPVGIEATWGQRLYLSVATNQSPSPDWPVVLDYLAKNGDDSLPKSYLDSILFNPSLTFNNFIYSLSLTPNPFLRTLGLFFILFFAPLFLGKKAINANAYHPIFIITFFLLVTFTIILCLQIMDDMQFRRFLFFVFAITISTVNYLYHYVPNRKLALAIMNANLLVIGIANLLLFGMQ